MQLLSELSPKFCELARTDSLPYAFHSVKEERQIVVGQKDAGQQLARKVQVSNKGPRMPATDRALERFIERLLIERIPGVFDIQLAARGEGLAVAAVPRGQDTIEHVDAARDRFDQVFGGADTHQVPWQARRHTRSNLFD